MGANRWIIVGILGAGVFGLLVLIGLFAPAPVARLLVYQDPVDTVFQGLVSAVITGVTLILTINQLILSQELGPVEEQHQRTQSAMEFREDIETTADLAIVPSKPSVLFVALLEAIRRKATALGDAVGDGVDGDIRDDIDDYVDDITEDADEVADRLDGVAFESHRFLPIVLQFNYSRKIHEGRRLRNIYGTDDLPDGVDEQLDDILEMLTFFAPARQHVKNLHLQWELINLSRAIFYTALPALVVTFAMILFFDPGMVPAGTFGVANRLWITSGALTIATLPFLTLFAYILRVGAISKRTLAVGPLVLQPTDWDEEIEWADDSD